MKYLMILLAVAMMAGCIEDAPIPDRTITRVYITEDFSPEEASVLKEGAGYWRDYFTFVFVTKAEYVHGQDLVVRVRTWEELKGKCGLWSSSADTEDGERRIAIRRDCVHPRLAAHEFGHSFLLDHVGEHTAVMYDGPWNGLTTSIQPADVDEVKRVWPELAQ